MKMKELEKLINEKVIEQGLDKQELTSRKIVWEVESIVTKLLKQYEKDLHVYNYNGKVIIKNSYSYNKYDSNITISIKKKVVGTSHHIWNFDTLYNVVKVEIPVEEDFTIEEFIQDYKEEQIRKENYKTQKLNDFEKQLKEKNIDFKEFYKMLENYKSLDYDKKKELAKKYAGEKYYNYL